MHSTAARANRSTIQPSISSTSAPSSLVHPQQQQILYGPIANPTITLQPCGNGLPSCIYPGAQRNTGLTNPAPLHIQGKSSRWPPKNKLVRNQQYCQQQQQQQHIQQQLSYSPKPLVLYDQATNNAPPLAPTTSFLIASSTYTHGSFSGDQYNNSGVTLIPQPYFKPPDVQTFCLIQDRQNIQQQEQPSHSSYYNISNTCNLQAINSTSAFQFPNLSPYAVTANFTNSQVTGPVQTIHSNQIFPNPPANLVYGSLQRDKPVVVSSATLDIPPLKVNKSKIPTVNTSQITPISSENYNEWPSQTIASPSNNLFNIKPNADDETNQIIANSLEKSTSNVSTKTQEEHYSDESSTSFDFTIEAEKMVSALCNISSNDINKEEMKTEKFNSTPLFNGAGDTASNKNSWFAEFCTDYGTGTSIAVQTDGPCLDRTQYPELLRKLIYWGCTEGEIFLNNSSKTNAKCNWLRNLCTATKTAVTKSSTCFPIFAGDRVFVGDLINALLRISNGWLILDNYLNKQHYPSLNNKFDCELLRCFHLWEESTHELLNQIVHTFLKLEENGDVSNFEQKSESFGTSFPGDVSIYTNRDLLDSSSTMIMSKQKSDNKRNSQDSCNGVQLSTGNLRNFSLYNVNQEKQSSQKESKLRSKWTITENLTTIDSTKSVPDMFLGHTESGSQANGRFRSRGNSSSAKTDMSAQSVNAEFFHLRSKILTESNQDTSRQWSFKEKKQEFPENKVSSQENVDTIFRLQRQLDENCESNYAQKCLSRVESSFLNPSINLESMYFPSTNEHDNFYHSYAVCPPYAVDYGNKNSKNFEQNHRNKTNMDLVYVGKSTTNQLELAAVPKDKMTLLSQIEPSIPEKSSEEMTANLSAWFASMRNADNRQMPFMNLTDMNTETVIPRGSTRPEMLKNTMDLNNCIRQLHIDANRQFQTLQNIQNVQTAPWSTYNLINNRTQMQQVSEEYDSSEDVRVYMKPGSYNVPKKRHQRRSNRRLENSSRNAANGSSNNHRSHYINNKEKTFCTPASSTPVSRPTTSISNNVNTSANIMKVPFPATPIVPPPIFSLENSPRILKRSDTCNYTVSEDVTWKAACASAEILLEALNVKEDANFKKTEINPIDVIEKFDNVRKSNNDDIMFQATQDQKKLEGSLLKNLKDNNDGCGGISSYEASEDDSGSTNHFSPNTSINEALQLPGNKNGSSKMNVKTDSWLIKTLNNANMANKQKRRKNSAVPHSSESSNSSVTENEQTIPVVSLVTNSTVTKVATTTTTVKNLQQTINSRKSSCISLNNDQTTSEETKRIIGKATYSETVRRYTSLSTSLSEKKEFCKKSKLNIANVSTICSTVIPIPGRKCQRKDFEKSYYLLHNRSRKCSGKRATKNCDVNDSQMEKTSKSTVAIKHGKKRENAGCIEFLDGKFGGKVSDRGWSVWYSSKRKQSLSPLALSKLEMIHQTVWQMKEAEVFKCPSSENNSDKQSSSYTIEDYCKVIKSPMFLETVEYKLKNRVYHKVEHVVRDFRRIVYNSKLYHKDDHDRVKTIETLSKKLEELFEEHFASWDFDNISGSPRESSPVLHRFKTAGQKSITGRYGNTKKCSSSSITDNI